MWKFTHFCAPISINTRTQTKNSSVTPLLISIKIHFWLGRGQFLKEKEYVFGANNSRVICFSLICSFLDATRLPIIQAHTYPGVSNFISKKHLAFWRKDGTTLNSNMSLYKKLRRNFTIPMVGRQSLAPSFIFNDFFCRGVFYNQIVNKI